MSLRIFVRDEQANCFACVENRTGEGVGEREFPVEEGSEFASVGKP